MVHARKEPLCDIQTAKTQISMHIHAACSEASLFVDLFYNTHQYYKWAVTPRSDDTNVKAGLSLQCHILLSIDCASFLPSL